MPKYSFPKKKIIEQFISIQKPIRDSLNLPMYEYFIDEMNDYPKSRDIINIKCPIHGIFKQTISAHKYGQGCSKCAREANRDTKESFIQKANRKHNNKYCYDKVVYKNSITKVTITCPIHGDFEQTPSAHINVSGCSKCGIQSTTKGNMLPLNEWLERTKDEQFIGFEFPNIEKIWNGAYTLIDIKCPKGHITKTSATSFTSSKHGCSICAEESRLKQRTLAHEDFVNRFYDVHLPSEYKIISEYKGMKSPITIHCNKHGNFEALPMNLLRGTGCQRCAYEQNTSKAENEIVSYINSLGIKYVQSSKIPLTNLELDIFIPDKQIAIEYNGLYWHNELHKDNDYHLQKTIECEKIGIKLIHVFEDEWIDETKQEIIKSRLKQVLGNQTKRLFARKAIIKQVPIEEEKQFLNKNHLQGYVASEICYGLYFNSELKALMSFGQLRRNLGSKSEFNVYEMYRFCTEINTTVTGGASKLFKYFINKFNPDKVISYADRRFTNTENNLYKAIGFKEVSISKPNYFYVDNGKRTNRYSKRKDVLISKYGCPEDMTEKEFCYSMGWYRIYDCGNIKFEYNINDDE